MADRLAAWLDQGIDVYAYLNNDWDGHAVVDARWLDGRLTGEAAGGAGEGDGDDDGGGTMPDKDDLPGTLQRSPAKAQRTYAKTLESAEETYGKGERASRTAMAAVKHSFEKVDDHWEAKDEKGPSDLGAKTPGPSGAHAGGVDVEGHTKAELYERARSLGIAGRSKMDKFELGQAIARAQD